MPERHRDLLALSAAFLLGIAAFFAFCGWWVLIGLIPIIGALWLLIELGFLKGTDGPNRYGPPVTD